MSRRAFPPSCPASAIMLPLPEIRTTSSTSGAYQLVVSLPQSSTPSQTSPSSPSSSTPTTPTTPTGPTTPAIPPVTNTTPQTAINLGWITQTTVTGLSFSSGSIAEYFNYQNGTEGAYEVTAAGVFIQVYNARGKVIAHGVNLVYVPAARAGTTYHLKLKSASGDALSGDSLSIGLRPALSAARKLNRAKAR